MNRLTRRSWLFGAFVGLGCRAAPRWQGSGSAAVAPLLLQWARLYDRETSVQIDYTATSSLSGAEQVHTHTSDFACLLRPRWAEPAVDWVQVPLAAGVLVPAYHLPGVAASVRFTPAVLQAIADGELTHWHDERLQALNPALRLPAQELRRVPQHECEPNVATAGQLRRTPFSFGYLDALTAQTAGVGVGLVADSASVASPERVLAVWAEPTHDALTFIAWLVQPAQGVNASAVAGFARWALTTGQTYARSLGYIPLPQPIVQHSLARLAEVTR
jgi:phosphate transport system substrate-binding protein